MFSYGSGLASSMFLLRVTDDLDFMKRKLNIHNRLKYRIKVTPVEYT